MTTTDSSTPCWKSGKLERLLLALLLCVLGLWSALARAEPGVPDADSLKVERQDDALVLSVSLKFDLSPAIEDALLKGLPIHFVAEADVVRDRWYWYDRKVAGATRYMRLAYLPLTRRWRLSIAAVPISSGTNGVTLSQNHDSLEDALASIRRIARWRIGDYADIESDAKYRLDFRFRLDVSQLPRPFQIGVAGQSDWSVSVSRSQKLTLESVR